MRLSIDEEADPVAGGEAEMDGGSRRGLRGQH